MFSDFTFIGLTGSLALLVIAVLLAILVFEIAMFVSVIRNKRITSNAKALWIVGMFLIHPLVAVVYYFTDYKKAV